MRILVTGGAGFIGSSLVDELLELGHEVVCLDNFDPFYDPALKYRNIRSAQTNKNFTLVKGDVRDSSALQRCLEGRRVDVVVHLAAMAGVRPSIRQPELYYDVNVMGTGRLLEAMRAFDVKKLVFGSSSSVYGNNPKVPFSESGSVDRPVSPYAATKKAGELLCHTYHHLYGFDISCLRFFTVYGPRQRPEMAIAKFTSKILKNEPIQLFGDGSTRRDYTYIGDIVKGLVASVEKVKGYEIINIGGAATISLRELVAKLEEITGSKAIIEWLEPQPGDVDTTYADISKASQLLEYSSEYPIERGLRDYVEWLKAWDCAYNVHDRMESGTCES